MRNENLDLLILKRVFDAVEANLVEEFVKATPTGIPSRRAWYLYELLTGVQTQRARRSGRAGRRSSRLGRILHG